MGGFMTNSDKLIMIDARDNVAVAAQNLTQGESIQGKDFCLTVREDVEKGHKIAFHDISEGGNIIKYGYPIGVATRVIMAGEYVHTHNSRTGLKGLLEYSYTAELVPGETKPPSEFMGYVRENGQIGIRNEIWIINTVGCVNKTAEILANKANSLYAGRVDGVFHFPHPYGCSQLGEDHQATQKILADLVMHPNAAGVLVLGLGCENNNIPEFKKRLGEWDNSRVKFLVTQEVEEEIGEGLLLLDELVAYAEGFKRQSCPASKLIVGLKCGGSDAFSGITANPLVGVFSDMLIGQGGTTLLTEVPEMFGAEQLLMNRCRDEQVFHKTVRLINGFKEYYMRHKQEVYENPSPGNKKGGISTLEEKSLGCTQKGGTSTVQNVLGYGDRVTGSGLNLLEGPGNDMVAVTALAAAGAHMILFTTGRGTPLGAPVPTLKISSNTELYDRKRNWIDYNAGPVLEGQSLKEAGEELFHLALAVAGGEVSTRNERNGYREIAIFKDGVTL
jgi:altronate hydrolase